MLHHTLITIIDSYPELRPPQSRGEGVCFGFTLHILMSLYAGNLNTLEETVNTIKNNFFYLSAAEIEVRLSEANSIIRTLKNGKNRKINLANEYLDILAFIQCICIAQLARDYQSNILGMHDDLQLQHDSIKRVSDFFFFQSNLFKEKKELIPIPGFVGLFSRKKVMQFLERVSLAIAHHNKPICFIVFNMVHSMGFGYYPKDECWIIANINQDNKEIARHTDISDMTNDIWKEVGSENFPYRILHINPIASLENKKSAEQKINHFIDAEDKKIAIYSKKQSTELYAMAYRHNDEKRIHKIDGHRNARLSGKQNSFKRNLNKVYGQDLSISIAISNHWDDLAHAIIWYDPEFDVNAIDQHGDTPLFCALKNKNDRLCETLLKIEQLQVHQKDDKNNTALYYALQNNDLNASLKLFNKMQPSLALNTEYGSHPEQWTLLHFAAYRGCVDIVKKMLDLGANVNALSTKSQTPLHLATAIGHQEIMTLLSSSTASINTCLQYGARTKAEPKFHASHSAFKRQNSF